MNSPVCVDARLIVRALVPGHFSQEAEALLVTWQQAITPLIAPALLAYEVTSTLRRMVYPETLLLARGDEAFAHVQRIDIRLSHRRTSFPLAWKLAKQFNRPRAYDTVYLALAQTSTCEFWTADRRLYNADHQELAWVHLGSASGWLGHYASRSNGESDV